MRRIRVVDSHTEGEPTRVVISGGPSLGAIDPQEAVQILRRDHDSFRTALLLEPRGHSAIVGALLIDPIDPDAATGVVFFNNTGYLGMCVHGTIGLAVTLHHLKRIEPGTHLIETPVGTVTVELHDRNSVSVENVESYRHRSGVRVTTDSFGEVEGDVAWGGNWFFLVSHSPVTVAPRNLRRLETLALEIRSALERDGVTGAQGAEIDHIELFGAPESPEAHSRNFVLCPGGAYDRSPCGTGTSAKLACLAEDGQLGEQRIWRQESIVGGIFEASYRVGTNGRVVPRINGRAWLTGESDLLMEPSDPFESGIDLAAG